jgi:histidyl-tRNA synthetase
MKPMQPVRGTADLMPRQKSQMNIVLEKASLIASRYGFQDKALTLLQKRHIALKIEGARA